MHVPAASVAVQVVGLLLEFCLNHQQKFTFDHCEHRNNCGWFQFPYISVQSINQMDVLGVTHFEHVLQLPCKSARIMHSLCGSCCTCSICFMTSCSKQVDALQQHAIVLSVSTSPAKTHAEPRYLHWYSQLTVSQQLACDRSTHLGVQRTGTVGAMATSKPKNADWKHSVLCRTPLGFSSEAGPMA